MSKKTRQHQHRQANASRVVTTVPAAATQPEPTSEQIARLEVADAQAATMLTEQGPAQTEEVPEPVGPTLEESLRRVEVLLRDARSRFEKARAREVAANAEEQRLAAQKEERDQGELDLLQRVESVDAREAALSMREAACIHQEAGVIEQAARITERELNAERGFSAEKVRALKPIEDEVDRLRAERDHLDVEIAERRAVREEEARYSAAKRAESSAQQDAERAAREAEARRMFDEDMATERQERLAKLRQELEAARQKAEADWQTKLDERSGALDAREAELEERRQAIAVKAKALHAVELDLETEREMLTVDRTALGRKVARLVAEASENLRHDLDSARSQLKDAQAKRNEYFREVESHREIDRRFAGRTPEEVVADLNAAEQERADLAQQLRERPDARATERLAVLERERSAWLEERAGLHGGLAKAQAELATRRLAAIELETLKKQKEALEVHKQLLDGAVDELRARVDELTRQEDHRNPMTALTSLDDNEELQAESRTTTPLGRATPTLREFADDLRHRIATGVDGRTLYYAERDVRAFLGGLAMTRLLLLQGISGTGKTSLPLAFANAVGGGIEIVEVQAGWRDRQDLVGYYNAFHRHYYATNFLQALYKAGTPAYRDRLFMMVLDEINLSRPEQFFADFLSALEQPTEARRLTLVNDPVTNAPRLMVDGRHLPIPPNVWFVGTANHDESTAEFADKTYDRAHVMEMPRKTEAAQFCVEARGPRNAVSYEKLDAAFAEAMEKQAVAVREATSWLRSAPFAASLGERFRVGWGNRLEHQLARYLPVILEAGGTVGEAMDHLLVTKILRKLKDRHDVRAAALEELNEQLLRSWESLDRASLPERCDALIKSEIAAKKGEDLV